MNELIKIERAEIGDKSVNTINARELHSFLGVGKDFSNWIKKQIERARLLENRDYVVFAQKGENLEGGRPSTEYHLTLESGKHIAMLSGTEKGFEVREYFIECEKIAHTQPAYQIKKDSPKTLLPVDKEFRAAVRMAKAAGLTGNQAILSANVLARKITGTDCLQLLDATHLINEKQEQYFTATEIGSIANIGSPRDVNKTLEKIGFQERHGNKWVVTEQGKRFAVVLDTGKKHSDGTMVQQIKWKEGVLLALAEGAAA